MLKQELTLFGGWAKAQIPRQIESGVVKPSDTLSVSIYISSNYNEEPLSLDPFNGPFSPHISIAREDKKVVVEAKKYANVTSEFWKGMFEKVIPLDPKVKWTEEKYGDGTTYRKFSAWTLAFLNTWIELAFLRFFEVWERGSLNDMGRGYAGTQELMRSFSGRIGGNYNGGHKHNKPLTKLPNGDWTLSNTRPLYPELRRLPPEGIECIRRHARELKEQRQRVKEVKEQEKLLEELDLLLLEEEKQGLLAMQMEEPLD